MLVGAASDRDDFARAARRLKSACPRSAVARCHRHDHASVHCVVESDRQQVSSSATRAVPPSDRLRTSIPSSTAASTALRMAWLVASQHVAGENIVIPQPRARSHAGHITDAHAVHDRSFAGYASRDASCVCPMILNRLRVEALLTSLFIEDFGNNDFWRDVLAILVFAGANCYLMHRTWGSPEDS